MFIHIIEQTSLPLDTTRILKLLLLIEPNIEKWSVFDHSTERNTNFLTYALKSSTNSPLVDFFIRVFLIHQFVEIPRIFTLYLEFGHHWCFITIKWVYLYRQLGALYKSQKIWRKHKQSAISIGFLCHTSRAFKVNVIGTIQRRNTSLHLWRF